MLEAKIEQGALLKKLVESIKDVVADINWDCNETGISLQAIDNAHVALVALLLRAEGFDPYRCDRNMTLGIKSESLSKILKCAGNDDKITIRAMDDSDSVTFVFEGSKWILFSTLVFLTNATENERLSEYQLKLMDIDTDHLGIPDNDEYEATVQLPSAEFQRICRDLSSIGDEGNILLILSIIWITYLYSKHLSGQRRHFI